MGGGGNDGGGRPLEFQIDMNYEFSAPQFFDFLNGETEQEACAAESWFKTAITYEASPYVAKIKSRGPLAAGTLISFQEPEKVEQLVARLSPKLLENGSTFASFTSECCPGEVSMLNFNESNGSANQITCQEMEVLTPHNANKIIDVPSKDSKANTAGSKSSQQSNSSAIAKEVKSTNKYIAKCIKSISVKKGNPTNISAAQENQAMKRQKLEVGRMRQILNIKEHILPHKVQSNMAAHKNSTVVTDKNKERKWNTASKLAKLASPFVSVAEKVRNFQTRTSGLLKKPVSHDGNIILPSQKPKVLTLTRPKEPELETAQRVRSVRVKSAAELEEEMLAKIPKFKARPLNKKILEAPSLPPLQKSTPHLPEFEEFHLKTMERALQHSDTCSSTDSSLIGQKQRYQFATTGLLTEPRPPRLETALRARPPKIKSSAEMEQEELEKIPKFKARPFDPKIFCSKGELGVFCNAKRQATTAVEFHFATNERLPPPLPPPVELFNKLSLNSDARCDPIPRLTLPQPFHLMTENRGAEKERKLLTELQEHEKREQEARLPKANPYPYTTDYPVIPPKPKPKQCTKPEPFQLESLVRHEEDLHRTMEERAKIEREEAEMRKFRAQPVMNNVPVHIPDKPRKPLTEVQEFTFRADIRAVERAEFDKKIKEKENQYKRFREECEAVKMVEEERAVKMMRKTMVPHARPVPSFDKPFVPQRSSKELTKPKSPRLRVNRKCRRQSLTASEQKKIQMR